MNASTQNLTTNSLPGGVPSTAGGDSGNLNSSSKTVDNSLNSKEFSGVLEGQQAATEAAAANPLGKDVLVTTQVLQTLQSLQTTLASNTAEAVEQVAGETGVELQSGNTLPLDGLELPSMSILDGTEELQMGDTGQARRTLPADDEAASALVASADFTQPLMATPAAQTVLTQDATPALQAATDAGNAKLSTNPALMSQSTVSRQTLGESSEPQQGALIATTAAQGQSAAATTAAGLVPPSMTALAQAVVSPEQTANRASSSATELLAGLNAAVSAQPVITSRTDAAGSELAQLYQQSSASTVQSNVPVVVGKAGWSESVMQRVMWMSSQQISRAEIALDPPELGPLQVRISTNGDQTSVTFSSHHGAVRDALDQGLARLREMMESQGIDLADVNVSDQSPQQREDANPDGSDDTGTAAMDGDGAQGDLSEGAQSGQGLMSAQLGLVDQYV